MATHIERATLLSDRSSYLQIGAPIRAPILYEEELLYINRNILFTNRSFYLYEIRC